MVSNLVRIRLSQSEPCSRRLLTWGFRETFRAEDRVEFARRLGRTLTTAQSRRRIARDIQRFQERDVAYWRPVIRDLRELRRQGVLLSQGTPIAPVGR